MEQKNPIKGLSNLNLGDLVLIKNFQKGVLGLSAKGPGIFLEYIDSRKMGAIIYNCESRRVVRVKITHLAPIKIC